MKKTVKINGMHCKHCAKRLETALNALEGVKVKVSFKENVAFITMKQPVADAEIITAIEGEGYEVVTIEEA
jgi:copper chaperone CopZ